VHALRDKATAVAAVLRAAGQSFNRHECLDRAAVIGYYGMLSLFPLLLGLAAITGMLLAPVKGQALVTAMHLFPGSAGLVQETVAAVIDDRGAIGLVSIVTLVWSARAVFGALRRGLNAVWEVPAARALHRQVLADVGLVLITIILLAGSVAITSVVSLLAWFGQSRGLGPVVALFSVLIPSVVGFAVLAFIYVFVPSAPVRFGHVWPGALAATLLLEIARALYVWYVVSFANYSSVYGSLGSMVGLLVWSWVLGVILLFGAEVGVAYGRRQAMKGAV